VDEPEPGQEVQLGTYKVSVIAESLSTGLQTEKALFLTVEKGEVVEIERVLVTGDLIPTGTMVVEIAVKNFRTTTVQDVPVETVVTSTHDIARYSDIIERIDPGQTVAVMNRLTLERYAPPGTYTVTARLSGGFDSETRQDFTVVQRAVPRSNEETRFFLLGSTTVLTVRNYGNAVLQEYTVTREVSDFDQHFFSGDVPTAKNQNTYSWRLVGIEPGEQATITYTVNYAPLVGIIIALAIGLWLIFFKVRTLRVKKYIMQKKVIKEGTEFTVGIELKNASGGKVTHVLVTDFVPSVFSVADTKGVAARKLKSGLGTELHWEINDLTPGEERVLSYKIVPVFGIQGQIKLPSAKVTFTSGRTTKTNSSFAPRLGVRAVVEEE